MINADAPSAVPWPRCYSPQRTPASSLAPLPSSAWAQLVDSAHLSGAERPHSSAILGWAGDQSSEPQARPQVTPLTRGALQWGCGRSFWKSRNPRNGWQSGTAPWPSGGPSESPGHRAGWLRASTDSAGCQLPALPHRAAWPTRRRHPPAWERRRTQAQLSTPPPGTWAGCVQRARCSAGLSVEPGDRRSAAGGDCRSAPSPAAASLPPPAGSG